LTKASGWLRVGFDGRDLLRKRTGVVNNAVYLARYMADRKRAHGPGETESQRAEFIVYVDRHVEERPPAGVPLRTIAAPGRLWKHLALPLALARDGVDLFHSPTGTLPVMAPCRQVVTIHDLFAVIEPQWFAPRVGRRLRVTQRRAAHVADMVIAVSERTKADLVERYRARAERIRVIYNGVDHSRLGPRDVDAEAVAKRYGVPYPFILCVGSLMPWRNAPRLLQATARLASARRLGLLFVGRDIWGTDPTASLAAEHGWSWARVAGYVPDEELPALYAAASVFAYPSLYEGFGIPPLEAMACGTPVVASTAGALPEVLGDAALLVDACDEKALASALEAALSDDGTLRKRGIERAARFRWEDAAAQTWRVYEEVTSGFGRAE
jgi:glycosyltransferase involved in cell wall biosynthesis